MLSDTLSYLPDNILTKIDRMSMANSLELRAPFLDHRVFDFAWSLPDEYLIYNGKGKFILREILHDIFPNTHVAKPKMGFSVPLADWLRGPLRDWSESLLHPKDLEAAGLEHRVIRKQWEQHTKGKKNWQKRIWSILMYRAWEERWLKN